MLVNDDFIWRMIVYIRDVHMGTVTRGLSHKYSATALV